MKFSSTNGQGKISRRTFLANSTALATAVGTLSDVAVAQDGRQNTGRITDRSKSDPGPTNAALDAQNPSSVAPPVTDAGSVPAFKYPFSLSHKRLHQGGWSREVTVRELPVSKSIAGVDMRLTAGGIRELHWHAAAEWAFMLYGSARITAIDANGKSFVADVSEGDLWYFPPGFPIPFRGWLRMVPSSYRRVAVLHQRQGKNEGIRNWSPCTDRGF